MTGGGNGDGAFSPRAALILVSGGAVLLLALLWMIGAGVTGADFNDGGGHAGGRGLNGYAGLAQLLRGEGYAVTLARGKAGLTAPGLLVLTPPVEAKGSDIDAIVRAHRRVGPVLVVIAKWQSMPAPAGTPGRRSGWVTLVGEAVPNWPGFRDEVRLRPGPLTRHGMATDWLASGIRGKLPVPERTVVGEGAGWVPLVTGHDERMLAGYVTGTRGSPGLAALAMGTASPSTAPDDHILPFPLVQIFEPDLVDNYGLAQADNARLAVALVAAATAGGAQSVAFDMTLNGFGAHANLLTLAFTPPFLAATLCLLLAAAAVAWRAFLRFGPPVAREREIALGKGALVENTAGLIRRAGRLHLIAAPYAALVQARIARALALPPSTDSAADAAAIDRALAARSIGAGFAAAAARLRDSAGASRGREAAMLSAARDLHRIEGMLER